MLEKIPVLHPNNSQYDIHDLREAIITGKRVEIGAGKAADRLLGCRFVDCEIRIKCSGAMTGVVVSTSSFDNCVIWPSKKQVIASTEAKFRNCVFKGRYEAGFYGEVVDCSFTEAKLDRAMFCDPTSMGNLELPKWPHVHIYNLDKYIDDFKASIPKMSLLWIMATKNPYSIIANIDLISKDSETLWANLKGKPYVETR